MLLNFPKQVMTEPPIVQIRKAFEEAGVLVPQELAIDGKIHRFQANKEKDKSNLSGWYVLFDSEYPAGAFGDYSRDISEKISTHGATPLTLQERMEQEKRIKQAMEARDKERAADAKKAAKECQELWNKAADCHAHPYLEKKHLSQAHGARLYDGKIILPLYNKDGVLVSLQTISEDGSKRYHKNGVTKGSYWKIGDGEPKYMAEGYATACSIFEATGKSCIVAYSANNLVEIAPLFPDVTIIADNDESGTGENKAKESKLPYIIIPKVGYDANDYATEFGIVELRKVIDPREPSLKLFSGVEILAMPKPKNWLIKGWLPRGPLFCMTFGPSGNGKTFVVIDRMLSIATGQPEWCGAKVNPGKVLYLCGEGSLDVRARIAVWCQEHNIIDLQNFVMSEEAANIDTPEGMHRVLESLEYYDFHPDLIVIDTLNRFMEGDENDTQNAGQFIAACAKLQNTFHACVNVVHHTGLSEDAQNRARGSSAFRGALDMQDMITKTGEVFKVEQTKNKGGREMEPVYLELEDHIINGWVDEDNEPIKCAVLVRTEGFKTEDESCEVVDKNKENMVEMFVKFGFRHEQYLCIKRDHLKKAFYEYVMERNPDVKNPQNTAAKALERALNPLLDDGSLTPFEMDLSGRVISYKTEGFKGFRKGILEPFFSFSLYREKVVTTCDKS